MGRQRVIGRLAGATLLAAAGHAALTWYRYGRTARGRGTDELLDRFLSTYEVGERHQAEVEAPADVTYAAVRALDLQRAPLVRGIFRARQLLMGGRTEAGPRPRGSFLDEVLALGWRVLAQVPERQIVFGAVTQPWRADVVFRGIPPEEFAAFAEPGYVKIAWTVAVTPLSPHASRFRTETRVIATDPASRARFRRYWTVVSPGILLIRREMVRQVRRDAERRAGAQLAEARAGSVRPTIESSTLAQARS